MRGLRKQLLQFLTAVAPAATARPRRRLRRKTRRRSGTGMTSAGRPPARGRHPRHSRARWHCTAAVAAALQSVWLQFHCRPVKQPRLQLSSMQRCCSSNAAQVVPAVCASAFPTSEPLPCTVHPSVLVPIINSTSTIACAAKMIAAALHQRIHQQQRQQRQFGDRTQNIKRCKLDLGL